MDRKRKGAMVRTEPPHSPKVAKADQLALGGFCILHARERHVLLIGCHVEQTNSEVARSLWVDGRGPSRLVLRRTGAVEHNISASMSRKTEGLCG